jgi:hypothetical protein
MYNNDGDSGDGEGRIRFGIGFEVGNLGMRTRFYQQNFSRMTSATDPNVERVGTDFIYAYGNLFDRQLKISAGLLGESPWGSGGPELFKELEYAPDGTPLLGIRFEWTPLFLPGLNLGFVLNRDDDQKGNDAEEHFGDLIAESVAGVAYEHDYFAFRFAYRFNSNLESPAAVMTGEKLVYRVEEHILGKILPGMSVSANGYCQGIGTAEKEIGKEIYMDPDGYIQNWVYILYDPEYFAAGLNIGYRDAFIAEQKFLEFRPSLFGKFFNNILNVGATGGIQMSLTDNGRAYPDAPYNFWYIEPQIRVNINSNFYAAAVYRYTAGYTYGKGDAKFTDQTTNWFNLRICYTF